MIKKREKNKCSERSKRGEQKVVVSPSATCTVYGEQRDLYMLTCTNTLMTKSKSGGRDE